MKKINTQDCSTIEQKHPTWKNYWYGLNTTTNFGCITYLYKNYGCPNTIQEFYNCYVSDMPTAMYKNCGRTEAFLWYKAKLLQTLVGDNAPFNDYFVYICKKLFYDTFYGCKKEKEIWDIYTNKGFSCESPSIDEDCKYGIDIKVYQDGALKYLFQVKPNTFFFGNRNASLINDRKSALQKEKLCNSIYHLPVYYYIYDKNTGEWLTNEKGGKGFKLKDLINNDGTSKNKL